MTINDSEQQSDTKSERRPMGQAWLRQHLGLKTLRPAVESYAIAGGRRTEVGAERTTELYHQSYWPGDSVVDHLKFSLRHEALDIATLAAAFKVIEPAVIETWVRQSPTGAYSRRVWFLYEKLTGRLLSLHDAKAGAYVPALDPARHIVAGRRDSQRHRVSDNLLGGRDLCITVRLTPKLKSFMEIDIAAAARELARHYDPELIARAVSFLYTKETRSSFAIEGEKPSPKRAERFASILRDAPAFAASDKAALVRLQNAIVDPRYAAGDWRDFQNYVGEMTADFSDKIHFICPRPQDVAGLMQGWTGLVDRLLNSAVDAVVSAAVISFAFVFIHPFEDGNGRIHRFLMHHVLARREITPPGFIFPVSAAIMRQRHGYDRVLEHFSAPLFDLIQWRFTSDQTIEVTNDTGDLYRYFDATAQAEYLYDRVIDTIDRDLREELGFLSIYDKATAAMREIVDMPDRRLTLFFKLCMQNSGRLSKAKREEFPELTPAEIDALEDAILSARG